MNEGGGTDAVDRPLGNWTPETLAARVATGECAVGEDWCFTHEKVADLGHYLDTRPAHNELGFAADD